MKVRHAVTAGGGAAGAAFLAVVIASSAITPGSGAASGSGGGTTGVGVTALTTTDLGAPLAGAGGTDARTATTAPRTGAGEERATPWQAALHAQDKAAAFTRVADEVATRPAGPAQAPVRLVTVKDVAGRPAITTVTLTGAAAVTAARAAAADPTVLALATDSRASATAVSNDTYRSQQWALDALSAEAVNAVHDASGVTVAVVDSGVQADHPDLKGVVLPGTDYVNPGGDGSADGNGHGTHVAGIVAAVANNGIGVAGLARGARILPVRVLDNTGSGWTSSIASGVIWAADRGAKVINLSLGGSTADPALQSAVDYATGKGVLIVAAAGNNRQNGNTISYPAAFPNALAVAATDSTGATASFSNTGSYVRIAAPGVSIASTYKGSAYASMSGTSMASPYVAATAAILASAAPSAGPAQLAAALTGTAIDKGAPGKDPEYGYGIVNPRAALCSLGWCGTSSPSPSTTGSPSVSPSTSPTTSPSTSPSTSPTTSPSTSPKFTPTTTPSGTPSPSTSPAKAPVGLTLRPLPTGLRYGDSFTVTGDVLAAGKPLAGAPVQACTRRVDGGVSCSTATSNASGVLTWTFVAYGVGQVSASYPGSATTAAATSTALTLAVLSRLSVTVPGKNWLNLYISPLLGQTVILERQNGTGWTTVVSRTLPNTGSNLQGGVSVSGLQSGVYRFRATTSGILTETVTQPVSL